MISIFLFIYYLLLVSPKDLITLLHLEERMVLLSPKNIWLNKISYGSLLISFLITESWVWAAIMYLLLPESLACRLVPVGWWQLLILLAFGMKILTSEGKRVICWYSTQTIIWVKQTLQNIYKTWSSLPPCPLEPFSCLPSMHQRETPWTVPAAGLSGSPQLR